MVRGGGVGASRGEPQPASVAPTRLTKRPARTLMGTALAELTKRHYPLGETSVNVEGTAMAQESVA